MVYRIGKLLTLIGDTWIEDVFHSLLQQPGHMSMSQLCRITFGFTGDGFHPLFKDCLCGIRGQYHTIAQFCEECEPERIIFPHIQHTRDTNGASGCLFCCEGFIVEQSVAFVFIQVRCRIFVLFFTQTSFTTVSCQVAVRLGIASPARIQMDAFAMVAKSAVRYSFTRGYGYGKDQSERR